MKDKNPKMRHMVSILVTVLVVSVLVMIGPVEAVHINMKSDQPVYKEGSTEVTFTASVDIQNHERVPIKKLTLKIGDVKECEFLPDGSNSCPNIQISVKSTDETEGDMVARGLGYVNEGDIIKNTETDFGYGYGYADVAGMQGMSGEIVYEIKWDIGTENVPAGKYDAVLEAYAENSGTEYTYVSTGVTPINIQEKSSNNGKK